MRAFRNLTVAAIFAALAMPPLAVTSSSAGTIVVATESPDAWFGGNEGPTGSLGEVTFTPGPMPAPSGYGAATLEIDGTGRASLGTVLFKGTPLSAISQLTYRSYASSSKTLTALALQFDVDYDATDTSSAYQGRLTFEPASAPTPDTWMSEDALAGTWWASQNPGKTVCPQSAPCTWAQVLAAFPNAAIRDDPVGAGALLFRLGGPIAGGAIAAVDDFTIDVGGLPTTFNFEPGGAINPSVGPAGQVITVQAYGFKPNGNVHVYYFTNITRSRKIQICSARASLTGSFDCAVALPLAPWSGPSGVHNVRIKGQRRIEYDTAFVLTP